MGPGSADFTSKGALAPFLCLVGFGAVVGLQLLPGLSAAGSPLSIEPFATQQYLFLTLVYLGAWMLVLLTVTTPARAAQLLMAIAATGVMQAAVAVMLQYSNARYLFFFEDFDQRGRATGTFVNPDHLAGYMELCLAAGIGWLISRVKLSQPPTAKNRWQSQLKGLLSFFLSPSMLLRLVLVTMVIALVMTHSRAGNGAFFIALLLLGVVVAIRSPALRRPALWLVASMAVVDLFVVGQWVGLDRVVERMSDTAQASMPAEGVFGRGAGQPAREQSLAERLEVPRLAVPLVAEAPWLGHGGGTFYTAFPPHKPAGFPLYWDHAHNDYVQVASDTGLIGLLLWVGIGIFTARRALWLLADRRSSMQRGLGAAGLMALMCMGMHSVVDFNLHITANALTFTILLAVLWSAGARRDAG